MSTQGHLFEARQKRIIRALSLTRPWPFAFLNGPEEERKRVENRSWQPPTFICGQYLALHAAKSWDEGDRRWIANTTGLYVPSDEESPHSQIFAVCRCVGFVWKQEMLAPSQRKWWIGPYGWVLEDVRALPEPIPSRGYQRLWGLPCEIERRIETFLQREPA
ncbi:MAG: hypothetical protein AB1631_31280 [Acidobacteriota bacterium]